MVELTKTKLTSLILAILATLGGTTYYASDTLKNTGLDNYFVCDLLPEPIQKFDRLSKSMERGYPLPDTTKGYIDCVDELGVRQNWVPLQDYAKLVGLDPYSLIEKQDNQTVDELKGFKIIVSPGKQGVTMNQIFIDYNNIKDGVPDFAIRYE